MGRGGGGGPQVFGIVGSDQEFHIKSVVVQYVINKRGGSTN